MVVMVEMVLIMAMVVTVDGIIRVMIDLILIILVVIDRIPV